MRAGIVLLGMGLAACSRQATPPSVDTTVAEQAATKAQEAANRAAAVNKSATNAGLTASPKAGAGKK